MSDQLSSLPLNAISTLTINNLVSGGVVRLERAEVPIDIVKPQPISDYIRSNASLVVRAEGVPPRLPSILPPAGTLELSCSLGPLIGAGRCGAVFGTESQSLSDPDAFVPPLALKISSHNPLINVAFAREKWFYDEMEFIQGVTIPRCYGLFAVDVPAELVSNVRPWHQAPFSDFQLDGNWKADFASRAREHSFSTEIMGSRDRLYVMVLERLGDMLPVGQPISEEDRDDIKSLYKDLGHLGVYGDAQVRRPNILRAPASPPGLAGSPSAITHKVHNWRLIDFSESYKGEFSEDYMFDMHMSYVDRLLDGLPRDFVAEP